jgi:hypothetical protein
MFHIEAQKPVNGDAPEWLIKYFPVEPPSNFGHILTQISILYSTFPVRWQVSTEPVQNIFHIIEIQV